ncbi:MAG: BON domain-containing protein [Ferruginibacter sp.]
MKLRGSIVTLFIATAIGLFSCAAKITDNDIKATIETRLKAAPDLSAAVIDVTNGIVTITGECKDEVSRENCEKIAQDVTGVKTVINNLATPAAAADTAVIAASPVAPVGDTVAIADDAGLNSPTDPLFIAVTNVTKKFPSVKADVKEGVVTLTGDIKKNDLPRLMKALSALRPTKIEQQLNLVKAIPVKNTRQKTMKAKTVKSKTVKAKYTKPKKRSGGRR